MKENLTDKAIVQRFFDRDEDVLTDVEARYGSYLFTVANNILQNTEDSKECVNDTYLSAWQKIPPHRPPVLLTFLAKITRGHAIDRWRQNRSLKRAAANTSYLSRSWRTSLPEAKRSHPPLRSANWRQVYLNS